LLEGSRHNHSDLHGSIGWWGSGVISSLQWARALAVLCVVLTHAIAHPFPGAPGAVHLLGRFGVTLFFVISGFIMVQTTGRGPFDGLLFVWRRVARIVPLYYIATGITVAGLLVAPWAFKETIFNLPHLIKSLLFIPGYEPGGTGRIDPVLRLGWTLQFEMFFYLCFASCFWLALKGRAILLTVFFGILVSLGQTVKFTDPILIFFTRIDTLGFIAGVWLAILLAKVPSDAARRLAPWGLALCGLSLSAIAFGYMVFKENPWTQVWLIVTCALLVAAFIALDQSSRSRVARFATYLGDASYSIYLFHMFGVAASTLVATRWLPREWLYLMMAVSFVLGTVAGLVAYHLAERPIRRWLSARR
jgi:exopolysaccharide production protein ExoZ